MFQEAFHKLWVAADSPRASAHRDLQCPHVVGGEISQFVGVEIAPAVLQRVEFGGVGRQVLDPQPVALGAQPSLGLSANVGRQVVPEQKHSPAHVTAQRAHESHHAQAVNAARLDREKKAQTVACGRKRQRPGDRQTFPIEAVFEDGGFSPRGPGAPHTGLLRTPAFIEDHERGAEPPLFFLMRGQSRRNHASTLASSRSRA